MRRRPPAADCDHAVAAEPDAGVDSERRRRRVAEGPGRGRVEQRRSAPRTPPRGARRRRGAAPAPGSLELAPDHDAGVGGGHPGLRRVAGPEPSATVQCRGRLPGRAVEARAVDARAGARALRPDRERDAGAGRDLRRALGVARPGARVDQRRRRPRAADGASRQHAEATALVLREDRGDGTGVIDGHGRAADVLRGQRTGVDPLGGLDRPADDTRCPERSVRPVGLQEGDHAIRTADGRGRGGDVAESDVERSRRAPCPARERRGPDAGLAAGRRVDPLHPRGDRASVGGDGERGGDHSPRAGAGVDRRGGQPGGLCGRRERGHQRGGRDDRAKRHAAQATHR